MTSSARGAPMGAGHRSGVLPGPSVASTSSTIPLQEQPRIPVNTNVPSKSSGGGSRQGRTSIPLHELPQIPTRAAATSKQNTTKTATNGASKGSQQGGDALSSVPRKISSCNLQGKKSLTTSRAGVARPSSIPADRSTAFAAHSSGSQFAWVPLHDTPQSVGGTGSPVDSYLWKRGPADPSGVVLDLSDRPLLCMNVRGSEAAIGSSDHGLYVVDVFTHKLQRNLYGKKFGHVDWVTCVDFLGDGRIISGGMDNMLCLWDATGVRCSVLTGHTASISGVKVIHERYGISASYDKTLLLWDLSGPQRNQSAGCLQGHRGAVLEFAVNSQGGIVSGSRDGEVILWDGREGKAVWRCKSAHDGHVTAVECLSAAAAADDDDDGGDGGKMLFLTGGQDGVLQVWDNRTNAPVHRVVLSRSVKGIGAVTNIAVTRLSAGGPPLVIAASADKILRVLEPRSSFQPLHVVDDHTDVIYSLYACGSLMWSGSGNGSLLVHDLSDGRCLYGLGATSNGAPRCISLVGPRALVVAGDDGNCMMYWV